VSSRPVRRPCPQGIARRLTAHEAIPSPWWIWGRPTPAVSRTRPMPDRGLTPPATTRGSTMSMFTKAEITYLTTDRRLARVSTDGRDGTPHIAPVGWSLDRTHDVIEVGGHDVANTKKFRDVARSGRAAIVIDDVLPPWRPRGIEIRGRAEAIEGPKPLIRIHPERIVGWGLDDTEMGSRNARDVTVGEG